MKIHDAVLSKKSCHVRHENILRCMRGIKIFLSSYSSNGSEKIELKRLFVVDNLVKWPVIKFNSMERRLYLDVIFYSVNQD